jgi:hypothetical protein
MQPPRVGSRRAARDVDDRGVRGSTRRPHQHAGDGPVLLVDHLRTTGTRQPPQLLRIPRPDAGRHRGSARPCALDSRAALTSASSCRCRLRGCGRHGRHLRRHAELDGHACRVRRGGGNDGKSHGLLEKTPISRQCPGRRTDSPTIRAPVISPDSSSPPCGSARCLAPTMSEGAGAARHPPPRPSLRSPPSPGAAGPPISGCP